MGKIVAFCGSKGSGKSTSAAIFKEVSTSEVEEIAIAGHLKEACAKVWNVSMSQFLDPKLKEVEFMTYIVLGRKDLETLLREFNITASVDNYTRPHIGRIIRTPRMLLQYIGTEVLHPIDPLVHIKMAMVKRDKTKTTLITDLRFVAEFRYLKENYDSEFVPVYVQNPYAEVAASVDSHPSERQYIEFIPQCRLLPNMRTLSDLRSDITRLVTEV